MSNEMYTCTKMNEELTSNQSPAPPRGNTNYTSEHKTHRTIVDRNHPEANLLIYVPNKPLLHASPSVHAIYKIQISPRRSAAE